MNKKLGLYVHVPFCLKKCKYCGFLSLAGCEDRIDEYFDALLQEIEVRLSSLIKSEQEEQVSSVIASAEDAQLSRAMDSAEDAHREDAYKIDTVFFGGGTPSLATPKNIRRVLEGLTPYLEEGAEITMEANPKTFDEVSLRAYREAGINRLSIGCQSLDDDVLKKLGRAHTKAEFLQGYKAARRAGFENVNVDLMFAVPGQDMELWKKTLHEIIELEPAPEHISTYSLQIEEGTPYYEEYKFGSLEGVSDAEERRMHHETIRMLTEAGYEQYEISNFAKCTGLAQIEGAERDSDCERLKGAERDSDCERLKGAERDGDCEKLKGAERDSDCEKLKSIERDCGREISECRERDYRCKHNLKYWNMDEYIGVGLGASSFVNGVRYKNIENLDEYIFASAKAGARESTDIFKQTERNFCLDSERAETFERNEGRFWFVGEQHCDSRADLAGETVFTGLRKREGFLKSRFEEIVGTSYDDFYNYIYEERKRFIQAGLLVETDERVFLTEDGIDRSNDIMSEFV